MDELLSSARVKRVYADADSRRVVTELDALLTKDPWAPAHQTILRLEDFNPSVDAALAFGRACADAIDRAVASLRGGADPIAVLDELATERARFAGSGGAEIGVRRVAEAADRLPPCTPLLSYDRRTRRLIVCRYSGYYRRAAALVPDPAAAATTRLERQESPWKEDHVWRHPTGALVEPTISDEIRPRCRDALTLRAVAEIHWSLAHLQPFRRGSAAISDMFARVILRAAGIVAPAWAAGVAPDLEAYVRTRADFARAYEGFFAEVPACR